MLDIVFINLIATTLERLCRSQSDQQAETAANLDRTGLIQGLIKAAPTPTGQLIERCVEDIWQSCQAVGLPAALAEQHLAVLPSLIEHADLSEENQQAFLAASPSPANPAIALTQHILDPMTAEGAQLPDGIDDTVLAYLLETYLTSLHASREFIQLIRPDIIKLTAPTATSFDPATPQSDATVTLAKIERADALGISVPLLEVITVTLINLTKTADLRHSDLSILAGEVAALDDALTQLPVRAPNIRNVFDPALSAYRAGRLTECDRLIAKAEDQIVRLSAEASPHNPELMSTALELRAARAKLHAISGSFNKAARFFGFAQRYIPRTGFETRWHYAQLEANHYQLAAIHASAPNALENAARAYTGALASIPDEQHNSSLHAQAQSSLASVLILLGERDQDSARFELAAQLLADAQECFENLEPGAATNNSVNHSSTDHLVEVIHRRADAMTRLGELHENGDLVEQAAILLQSHLTGSTNHGDTVRTTRTRLALSLYSYGVLADEIKIRERAVEIIQQELNDPNPPTATFSIAGTAHNVLSARCHLALAHSADDNTAAGAHRAQAASNFIEAGFTARAAALSEKDAGTSKVQHKLTDSKANAA